MKTTQITRDEALLAKLDADAEVRRDGRSAVILRAVEEYLDRRRAIAEQYTKAYGAGDDVREDLGGWQDEGVWPERSTSDT